MLGTDNANKCPSIFHEAFSNPYLIERCLLIIYIIIFFIGLIGNIMTIIIIKYNTHLRTPTNFYLLNLAVSDLMMLMCNLPLEMIEIHFRQWPLPTAFCWLRNICAEFFTCSSILTILAFTCERYFAIVHPVHFHHLSHFRRAQNVILIIWFISLIFSVPFGFSYEISSYSVISHTNASVEIFCKTCVPKKSIEKLLSIIVIITSFGFFYVPMIIIGTIYLFIGKALRRANKYENPSENIQSNVTSLSSISNGGKKPTNTSPLNTPRGTIDTKSKINQLGSYSWLKTRARCQARRVVVKTLVAVVIAFFVCYAPLYLQRLLLAIMGITSNLNSVSPVFSKIIAYLYVISGATFYFGSVINPILYNVVSNKYRRAFRDLFYCRLTYNAKSNQRKFYQIKRGNPNPPIDYLVKKSLIIQPMNNINNRLDRDPEQQQQQKPNGNQHETVPIVKRRISSNTQSSRSNSSSISSHNREDYLIHSHNSHASLGKECQVIKLKKSSLRRKILGQKQPANTIF